MRSQIVALAALSSLVCASCDGSESVPLDQFDKALAEAHCEMLSKCTDTWSGVALPPSEASLSTIFERHPGAVTCAEEARGAPTYSFHYVDSIRGLIEAGRIEYDGAAAKRCIDAVASTCPWPNAFQVDPPACDATFVGQVALGATCQRDEECAGAARCDYGTSGSTCGTCVPLKAIGEACNIMSDCAQDLPNGFAACWPSAGPDLQCYAVAVRANVPLGGTCGLDAVHTPATYASCAGNLYCDYAASTGNLGVCSTPNAVGQSCAPGTAPCADDAMCVVTPGSGIGSCEAITVLTEVGAPCDESQLRFCNPLDRLTCVSGACVLVGTGALGQPCRTDHVDCNEGLYCDPTTPSAFGGLCANQVPVGSPCTSSAQCATLACDKTTNPAMPVCATHLPLQCE